MKFPFWKMQACGNDFVVIDHVTGVPAGFALPRELAEKISHRQFGVGCDQILWLRPAAEAGGPAAGEAGAGLAASFAAVAGDGEGAPSVGRPADALVWILNSDGSRAEMCGNGMRAVALHLARRGPRPGLKRYDVLVSAGRAPIPVALDLSGEWPEVALGQPTAFEAREKIALDGPALGLRSSSPGVFTRVEIGNPHAVFFLGEENPQFGGDAAALAALDIARVGTYVERHKLFPNRTNVEFAVVESPTKLRVRVWERGAGATLACGSGACAAVAAAEARGYVREGERIEVALPGGSVFVRLERGWRKGQGAALLSGPAADVFRGEWSSD